jgi:hypothetical protein
MVVLSIFSGIFFYVNNTSFFFIGIYFFYFISNNNCWLLTTVQMFDIIIRQLRYAILLALEMMNEWTPTFFKNIFT